VDIPLSSPLPHVFLTPLARMIFLSGHRVKNKFVRDWRHGQDTPAWPHFFTLFFLVWFGLVVSVFFSPFRDDVHLFCMLGGRLEGIDVGVFTNIMTFLFLIFFLSAGFVR
jgi:hypothetical protein